MLEKTEYLWISNCFGLLLDEYQVFLLLTCLISMLFLSLYIFKNYLISMQILFSICFSSWYFVFFAFKILEVVWITTFSSKLVFKGFGTGTNTPAGGIFGQTQTPGGSMFGAAGSSGFGGGNVPNGTTLKYNPPTSQDTMVKNGQTQNINTRHQCITAMKEYQAKSLEVYITVMQKYKTKSLVVCIIAMKEFEVMYHWNRGISNK